MAAANKRIVIILVQGGLVNGGSKSSTGIQDASRVMEETPMPMRLARDILKSLYKSFNFAVHSS